MRVLLIGDIVGKPGRKAVKEFLPGIVQEHRVDYVIADADNVAGGFGLTSEKANELRAYGVHGFTLGNHVWDPKTAMQMVEEESFMARPANFPEGSPGVGWFVLDGLAGRLAVLHLQGRIFMDPIDCPFQTADKLIPTIKEETNCILVDFHAEATSEKQAIGFYLDGRVSAVIGIHTHVPTCDDRILRNGTGFQTDCGMTGAYESIIGMNKDEPIAKMKDHRRVRFEPATDDIRFSGTVIELDNETGKCLTIHRVMEHLQD